MSESSDLTPSSMVSSIYSRIEYQLPVRSKISISTYRSDPFYMVSKKALINLGDTDYLQEICTCTYNLLISLNEMESHDKMILIPLRERSLCNLKSNYLLLRLLSDILENNWQKSEGKMNDYKFKESSIVNNSKAVSSKLIHNSVLSAANTSINFHTVRPRPIPPPIVSKLLSYLAKLKTNNDILQKLEMITNHLYQNPNNKISPEGSDKAIEAELIELVDSNIDTVVKYIAASNPTEFFEYLNTRLRNVNLDHHIITRCDFLSLAYIDSSNIISFFNLVRDIVVNIKRVSQQNILLAFLDKALDDWIISRPLDYIKATKNTNVAIAADSLFEIVFKFADWKVYYKSVYSFLASLLLLIPIQFQKYLQSNTEKHTSKLSNISLKRLSSKFTNKQKVIAELINIVHKHPTAGNAITKILLSASVICFLKTSVEHKDLAADTESDYLSIITFSKQMCKPLCRHLSLDHPNYYPADIDAQTFDSLRYSFFASFIVLEPDLVDTVIPDLLRDRKETLKHVLYIFNGLELLTNIPLFFENGKSRFYKINELVLPMLQKASKELILYDERLSGLDENENDAESISSKKSSASLMDMMDVLQQRYINNRGGANNTASMSSASIGTTSISDNSGNTVTPVHTSTSVAKPSLASQPPTSNSPGHHHHGSSIKNFYKPTKNIASRVFQSVSSSSSSSGSGGSTSQLIKELSANDDLNESHDSRSTLHLDSEQSTSSLPSRSTTPLSLASPLSAQPSHNENPSSNSSEFVKPRHFMLSYEFPPSEYIKLPLIPNEISANVVKCLLRIYIKFPIFALESNGPIDLEDPISKTYEESFFKLVIPISRLLLSPDEEVRTTVDTFFLNLCSTCSEARGSLMAATYFASAICIDAIAKLSLNPIVSTEERTTLMEFLSRFLDLREHVISIEDLNQYLSNNAYHETGGCARLVSNLEKCIYLGLFSSNLELYHISRRSLGHYLFIIDSNYHLPNCFQRYAMELCKAIMEDKSPVGESAIRKKLRDHLCKLKGPTDSLIEIWEIMFEKFCSVHNILPDDHEDHNADTENDLDRVISLHDDYGEYIASLGGIIMSPEMIDHPKRQVLEDHLTFFFRYKMKNLFTNNHKRSDSIREVLCVSMHPNCTGLILKLLGNHVETFAQCLKEKLFNICELMILVTRTATQLDYESLFAHSVALIDLNISLLNSLKNYESDRDYTYDPVYQRLKLKLIKLQTLLASRMDELALYGMSLKKNQYARIVVEYLENSFKFLTPTSESVPSKLLNFDSSTSVPTSAVSISGITTSSNATITADSTSRPPISASALSGTGVSSPLGGSDIPKKRSVSVASVSGYTKTPELLELQYDVAFEASSTLKYVFYDLPVDNYKNLGLARDSDDIVSMFTHYFNLFVRILEYLNLEKNNAANINANLTIKHRSTNIVKNVIDILVNLLQSNVDLGVRNAIPLGFHEDRLLRVSFINVFSKIISDVQAKGKMINSEDFAFLEFKSMELLANETELYLAVVQCANLSEVDELASAFMTISNDKKKILEILTNLIKHDILNTTDSVEILRSNTVATRMLAIFSQKEGSEYVAKILTPFLEEFERTNDSFEVERIKADDPAAEHNIELFWKYLRLLIDTICNSISYMPHGLRVVAHMVYEATSVNFPESKIAALGAFFFLRIINPAIISPERVGIETHKDAQRSRSLIQIARVLQLMANETVTTLKWPLLVDHIDELKKLKTRVNQFMHEASAEITEEEEAKYSNEIATRDENDPNETSQTLRSTFHNRDVDYSSCYKFFHTFFYDHYTELCDNYLNPVRRDEVSMKHKIRIIRRINNFQKIVGVPQRVIGYQIPEGVRNNKSEKGILLYDFMTQYTLRGGMEKCEFVKVQTTRDGFPMVVIVYKDIPEGYTYDMIAYCLLQVMTKYWDSSFCIMIDCTLFTSSFDPKAIMELLVSLVDEKYLVNCIRYYNFNMSHEYYDSVQLHMVKSDLITILTNAEVIFLSSSDDPKTFNKYGMNVYKNEATEDSRVTFNDISLYQAESKRLVSARLMIGNEYLHVIENQSARVKLNNKKIKAIRLIDVYCISELRNISTSNYTGVANEISIFDERTGKNLILVSKKRVEIMRTLYFSKSRYSRDTQEIENLRKSKEHEEGKDVLRSSLGYILHMSFTGLLSIHEDVRSASLMLLSSVVKSYKLDAGRTIETVADLSIPSEDINFIIRVSQSLCENHPSLTFNFLTAFFDTYNSLKSINVKTSLVIYTSPWLTHIYQHILLGDPRYGLKRTIDLVHRFVKLTKDRSVFVVALSKLIWSPLCLEDNIGDIVVDEIVAACIDHEAEGHGWSEMAGLWPVSSSIRLCDLIIKRLHEKSHMLFTNAVSDVELHTRWIELSVMVKFLSYMIYNVDLFVNLYLGELLFIISVFVDIGPIEFRASILRLTTRTFHSFLTKSELSPAQVSAIKEKIESLNGARCRMLFGLTRAGDDVNALYELPKAGEMMNRVHSVEAVCELLFSLVDDCGSAITNDKWIVNWTTCTLKLVFKNDAFLQSRAIMIYGSLCKAGINNTVLYRFLQLIAQSMNTFTKAEKYLASETSIVVCELHALRKMICQLPKHTHFVGKFFWLATSLSLIDNFTFYQFAIQILAQAFTNIDKESDRTGGSGVEFIFSQRAIFGRDLDSFEKNHNISFTRETFDIVLLHLCAKGLLVPFSYINALNSLKTIFRIRLKWEKKAALKENRPVDISVFCYVLILYKLFNTDEEILQVLEECGLTDFEVVEVSDSFHCPKQLVDFLVSDTFQTHCAVVISSGFINNKRNSDSSITRNFELYKYVWHLDPTICWRVFPAIIPSMERYAESSKSLNVLKLVLPLMEEMILDPRYAKRNEYSQQLQASISEMKVEGITESGFTNSNPFDYATEEKLPFERRQRDATFIRKAILRIMSTHIEDE